MRFYIKNQIFRFIIIGLISVLLDFVSYLILFSYLNFDIIISKGISFIIGSLFSYFGNKNYTFNSSSSKVKFFRFFILYIFTLYINTYSNSYFIFIFSEFEFYFYVAFLLSTFISATINFVMMKKFIFNNKL